MFFNEAHAAVLPIAATDAAVSWNALYDFLIWISIFFFVFVVGAMIYFVIKYRNRPGHKAVYETGSHLLEAVWIGIPTVLLLIIFGWGYHVYREMRQTPADAYEIKVVGKQWLWTFMYDNGTTTVGELYVPVNKPVKLLMTSQDVLHGFFIPNFRVKQDVVPGMYSSIWFEATVPGKHQVFCTEYCGTSHSGMLAQVIALDEKDWNDWLRGKKIAVDKIPNANAANLEAAATGDTTPSTQAVERSTAATANAPQLTMVQQGEKVYNKMACATCHSTDGATKAGPTFKALFGSKVTLTDGTVVTADENYIRESIELPNAKIVKGYAPQMPTFKGLINEQDMASVISFIKAQK
jgi:cytochrome c oxidase subunit 2